MGAPHAHVVGEEHEVELGAFGGLRQLDVVPEVDAGVGLGVGVAPRRHVVAGRVEEGAEPHVALASAHDILARRSFCAARWPCAPAALDRRGAIYESLTVMTNRSEEHTSELQSLRHLVCRLLLEKKKTNH